MVTQRVRSDTHIQRYHAITGRRCRHCRLDCRLRGFKRSPPSRRSRYPWIHGGFNLGGNYLNRDKFDVYRDILRWIDCDVSWG